MARAQELAWGPEIVFTYGPLGFLQTTAYYSFYQSLLATIYQPIVVAALFLGIAAALRRRHAPMTSLIGAFLTTGVVVTLHISSVVPGLEYPELAVLAAFAWAAVPLLEQDPKRSTVFITCIVLGTVAGLQLLVKLNTGMAIVVIAVAMSVLHDWRALGRHFITVMVFATSTLIWWVLAGQRPGDLPTWLRSSAAIVLGYSEAQAYPLPSVVAMAVPAVVLSLGWVGMLCVMFIRGGTATPRRFVLFVGLMTVIIVKKEFVRLGLTSFYPVLGFIVVMMAITPLSSIPKIPRRTYVGIVAAIVFVGLIAESATVRATGDSSYDPIAAAVQAPRQALDRLFTLALPGQVDRRIEQAKARQRALYAIPDRFVKTIGSGTVHIDPDEASAVWAYDFAWRPAPVFQTYAAYTPALDDLNSQSLATGPRFVLSRRSPTSPATDIDGRLGVQESPRYSRALLCNYTVSGAENRWALFTRTGGHCGPLTPLSQVLVHGNNPIAVPIPSRPDMAILVGIDLKPTVVDRLFQGTVAPLTISTVVLDGVSYRLVTQNAAEPFLVDTPASVDGTNLQIHAGVIGVGRAPSLDQGDVTARLNFYEMRVQP